VDPHSGVDGLAPIDLRHIYIHKEVVSPSLR